MPQSSTSPYGGERPEPGGRFHPPAPARALGTCGGGTFVSVRWPLLFHEDGMTATSLTSPTSIQLARTAMPHVGNTPLVRLERITTELIDSVEIWAKAEWSNPSGSVKDRPAYAILRQALDRGALDDGRILLDSTSGNMGISYATLAAPLGLPVHLALPANASAERLAMLRALGAQPTLPHPTEGSEGAREVAAHLAAEQPDLFYYADQYNHPANWESHFRTTGPELLSQTNGRLSHFVAGLGTTGTVPGAGRVLRQHAPEVRICGVQPAAPLHGPGGL